MCKICLSRCPLVSWAFSLPSYLQDKIRSLERQALLTISPVHKGTPTDALAVIHDVTPLRFKAQELAYSADDRISRVLHPQWDGKGDQGLGHLAHIRKEKPVQDLPMDYTDKDNWSNRNSFFDPFSSILLTLAQWT